MSKNFLNFLTTSVIILSCGTVINSSSCYCMESKNLSQQDPELSKKLSNELSKMDADINDELKRNHIIVDNNGQPIENASFFIKDLLRSYQILYNNDLNAVLEIISIPNYIIQQFNDCMTLCMHIGDTIGNIFQHVWTDYYNKFASNIYDIKQLIGGICYDLHKFGRQADNNATKTLIYEVDSLLREISSVLNRLRNNLSNYNNYDHVLQNELISKLQMNISALQKSLINPSSNNKDHHKNTDDIFKNELKQLLFSIIIPDLQQLHSVLSTHSNDNANLLQAISQAISASQPIASLTNIMEGTGETFNINNDNINNITWQQWLNYFQNKILLRSINGMQNITEYITKLIKNNTINVKNIEKTTNTQIITCCNTVLSIAYNVKEYLSSMSNNSNLDYKQRDLAMKINDEISLNRYIRLLEDATKQLQKIENKYNNKNIKNIKNKLKHYNQNNKDDNELFTTGFGGGSEDKQFTQTKYKTTKK